MPCASTIRKRVWGTIGRDIKAEGGAAWDDDIVALVIGQQAEIGFQHAMPIVDKVDHVALTVAIEVVHRLCGLSDTDGQIFVVHQHLIAQHGIAAGLKLRGLEMMMALDIARATPQAGVC